MGDNNFYRAENRIDYYRYFTGPIPQGFKNDMKMGFHTPLRSFLNIRDYLRTVKPVEESYGYSFVPVHQFTSMTRLFVSTMDFVEAGWGRYLRVHGEYADSVADFIISIMPYYDNPIWLQRMQFHDGLPENNSVVDALMTSYTKMSCLTTAGNSFRIELNQQ